jgi:GNAT superfamily N-acetyltransferase
MIVVRRIGPEEWQQWRTLRLAALAETPYAYRSTIEEWTGPGDTEEHWRTWLADVPLTLVAELDGRPVGLAGAIGPFRGELELVAMWVAPGARGHGVGDALVEAVVGWGRSQGARRLVVEVLASNQVAIDLYRRQGFVDAGPLSSAARPAPTRAMVRSLGEPEMAPGCGGQKPG